MKLNDFGNRSGCRLPPVNIGAMRLPRDLDDAVKVVRHAIDSGMRYIDVSRGYGEAEWALSRALQDGYREKVFLSTKWSPWILKVRPDDCISANCERRRMEESMKRLGVNHLDFYQLWNINSRERWDKATAPGGMLETMINARDDGLVDHLGFTTHDSVENVLDYIEEADWCESILFSYNILDMTYAPAIEAACKKGIGVQVMNPVGGGKLAEESPVLMKIAEKVGAVSPADLSIRYVLSNPHVDFILSGISRISDIDDTIASAERPRFTGKEIAEIEEFARSVNPDNTGYCTGCGYCAPCPEGIDIPKIMNCVYLYRILGLRKSAMRIYGRINGPGAEACTACGHCRTKCTQKIDIPAEMKWARKTFSMLKKEK